jgi:hypothetical protein
MNKNANRKGKITITGIIVMAVLFYGGFVAFKIITSSLTKTQIKNEIIDKFGFVRGAQFTAEKGREIVEEVLEAHGFLTRDEDLTRAEEDEDTYIDESEIDRESDLIRDQTKIFTEVKDRGSKAWFRVVYTDIVDLIFFKHKMHYDFQDEVINYN